MTGEPPSIHGSTDSEDPDTMDGTTVSISSPRLSAEIALLGGELVRLRDEAGRDLLWDGDPAHWTGHAPILFPIVGRLKGDHLDVRGARYPMRQHGLARRATFAMAESGENACRLTLAADAETRQAYPFDFRLDLDYRIEGATLSVTGTVRNAGDASMPASFGFHPAFRWPLPYGARPQDHSIAFEADEPEPIAAVVDGLLSPDRKPTPVRGRVLALEPHLFDADALIFLEPRSRSVRYGPAEGRGLRVDFPGMPQLGIWSKPGAPFVCVEPWHGYASPADFDGDAFDKPGMIPIPPGEGRSFAMRITLEGA